jgi:hypothetical protein
MQHCKDVGRECQREEATGHEKALRTIKHTLLALVRACTGVRARV